MRCNMIVWWMNSPLKRSIFAEWCCCVRPFLPDRSVHVTWTSTEAHQSSLFMDVLSRSVAMVFVSTMLIESVLVKLTSANFIATTQTHYSQTLHKMAPSLYIWALHRSRIHRRHRSSIDVRYLLGRGRFYISEYSTILRTFFFRQLVLSWAILLLVNKPAVY